MNAENDENQFQPGIGVIMPFCVYHSIDHETKTCLAYLSNPAKTYTDNEHQYYCPHIPSTAESWTLAGTFYAVRPTLWPIPSGLRLFCARKSKSYPYDTTDVSLVYDPYLLETSEHGGECVYFIAYNLPVPSTVPLYLHKQGPHMFPSFEKEPPYANELEWETPDFHVIYVMTKESVGQTVEHIKFTCLNRRCVPSKEIPGDVHNDTPGELGFNDCLLHCNEMLPNTQTTRSLTGRGDEDPSWNVFQNVLAQTRPVLASKAQNIPPWAIATIVCVCVFVVFLSIYLLAFQKQK
jgi:hypothetical protein